MMYLLIALMSAGFWAWIASLIYRPAWPWVLIIAFILALGPLSVCARAATR